MSTPEVVSNGVTFEVERFEWVDDDRLEVTGRWYGLRGHRFVRPVLVVQAGDEQRRMLAVLEHKPWAADDGEEWIAAFPWEGAAARAHAAELAVAPSLAVDLPMPRVPGRRGKAPAASEGPLPARRGPAEPASARTPGRAAAPARHARATRASAPRRWPRCAPSSPASRPRCAAWPPSSRRPIRASPPPAPRPTTTTRSSASATRRSPARDEARARTNLDHDAIVEERDTAVHERSAALYERDEALDERAAADFERKTAIAERDAAFAERDRAVEAHRAAVRDLEALEQRVAEAEKARAEQARGEQPAIQPAAGAVRTIPGERRRQAPRPSAASCGSSASSR